MATPARSEEDPIDQVVPDQPKDEIQELSADPETSVEPESQVSEAKSEDVEKNETKNVEAEKPQDEIIIEPQEVEMITKTCDCKLSFGAPYRERRSSWGGLFGVGYGFYTPTNYVPNYSVGQDYSSYYGKSNPGMVDAQLSLKKNFSGGSMSLDFGGGQFTASGQNNTTLSVTPIHVGLSYFMDTLAKEPYVVPYVSGGGIMMVYKESVASQVVGGNTQPGFFYAAGVAFQLDWMDEYGDRYAYEDQGIENAFLFVEGRGIVATVAPQSPDFGAPIYANLGLRFEF